MDGVRLMPEQARKDTQITLNGADIIALSRIIDIGVPIMLDMIKKDEGITGQRGAKLLRETLLWQNRMHKVFDEAIRSLEAKE